MTLEENLLHRNEIETSILGAISVDNSVIPDVVDFVNTEMFSFPENKAIFQSILNVYEQGVEVDATSIFADIHKRGLSDRINAYEVTSRMPYTTPNKAVHYAKLVAESFIKQELSGRLKGLASKADNPTEDAFELLETSMKSIEEVGGVVSGSKENASEDFSSLIDQLGEDLMKQESDTLSGVPSGLSQLDDITSGFQNGELIIIAGRPAMGKSAFVTTIIKNAAMQGFPCMLFSLEMPKKKVLGRISSSITQLNVSDINKKRLHNDQRDYWIDTMKSFNDMPIFINDKPAITLTQVKSEARKMKRKHGLSLLVIDYLQLMGSEGGSSRNREQEVSEISKGLKALAMELDIPIIALSQLSRAVENRDVPRPILSDLRESGSIEQDANIVAFLYRAEYYSQGRGEEVHPDDKGIAQLLIAKNRDGELADIDMRFRGEYSLFEDLEIRL